MSVIVNIDHETGDLTQYTSTVADGGDLSVAAGAALAGTGYGLSALIDDTTSFYGVKSGLNNTSGQFRARFYLNRNTLTAAAANIFNIFRTFNTSSQQLSIAYLRVTTIPTYRIKVSIFLDSGSYVDSAYYNITDAPHYIEIHLIRASSAVASDGSLQFWIDVVSK